MRFIEDRTLGGRRRIGQASYTALLRDVSARDETARYGDARGKVRGKCGESAGKVRESLGKARAGEGVRTSRRARASRSRRMRTHGGAAVAADQ
ncbi:hypothetical protein E2R23_23135 [Burkholderia pseudomallei]|nr:hypothetical protein EXY28_23115 [Burkholderia pseudomallei]QBI49333.1 hypothetical protein EXY72_23180 [Burkholderia pseudomallei]QBL80592.1 hypothetical protein EYA82_22935 [Burkholderia pseudomallei]QBL87182.1 hypothetical protein EYA88_22570 [Burkholderia pseudomallei]QBP51070.1 hypothetical protein E2R28_22875 [Burkholderia pseudomallei]